MLKRLKEFFKKSDEQIISVPTQTRAQFILKLDDMVVGFLDFEDGEWCFKYSDSFKEQADVYYPIPGFPRLDKEYRSEFLWPFFKIRIPGLKQPVVKEILENEVIAKDEVSLLKRFGFRSIANPYLLLPPTPAQ